MPPRGYRRPTGPTIGAQTRGKIDSVKTDVRKVISTLFSGEDPAITGNPKLQKQTIPGGYEAVTIIPDWATAGTRPEIADPTNKWDVYNADRRSHKERINPETLNHAIRIRGTNHIFTSEATLTELQLERAARDFETAIAKVGHRFPDGVAMHVPTAANFGTDGANGFVRFSAGDRRTFYINPKVVKRDRNAIETRHIDAEMHRGLNWAQAKKVAAANGQPEPSRDAPEFGWLMPASRNPDQSAVYTMVHEMGHIDDDIHSNTGSFGHASMANGDRARKLHNRMKPKLSEYGRSKVTEGYAEAYVQYYLGGPGTSEAADEYAKEHGWQ